MSENTLIAMEGFVLPIDLPWRSGLVMWVNEQLRCMRVAGEFIPPRFIGYYFQDGAPVGVAGAWTVLLDQNEPMLRMHRMLKQMTLDVYSIECTGDNTPDYILVHDRKSPGACWLWCYSWGIKFIVANNPVSYE